MNSKDPLNFKNVTNEGNDILRTVSPALKFARIFGVLPLLTPKVDSNRGSKYILLLLYTLCLGACIVLILIQSIWEYQAANKYEGECSSSTCYIRRIPNVVYNIFCLMVLGYSVMAAHMFANLVPWWNTVVENVTSFHDMVIPKPSTGVPTTGQLPLKKSMLLMAAYYGFIYLEHGIHELWVFVLYNRGGKVHLYDSYVNYYWTTNFNQSSQDSQYSLLITIPYYITSNLHMTFIYNFTDVMVMLFGMCLSHNFQLFNEALVDFAKTKRHRIEWLGARNTHRNLCEIVDSVDDILSPVIFASNATGIFFLCYQIYNHFLFYSLPQTEENRIRSIYELLLVSQLVIRLIGVGFIAEDLRKEGKEPLYILREYEWYNAEVQRFWHHVIDYNVAFTGAKLYVIERGFLLNILSIVLTYEMLFLGLM